MIFFSSVVILVIAVVQSHEKTSVLSQSGNITDVQVTGSLITFCGSPTLYSPVIPTVPLNVAADVYGLHSPKWETDWEIKCLKSRAEMVDYCRRLFVNTKEIVTDVMLATAAVPLRLPTQDILPNSGKVLSKVKVVEVKPYWCLTGQLQCDNNTQCSHNPLPPATHDLLTIFDIHRAFFLQRLNQLNNRTDEAIIHLVKHVIHAVKQLTSLPAVKHRQVLLLTSNLLQSAHQQMQSVWTSNEVQWNKLEAQRHLKVATELASEDVAGEHEFAYVLQEPGATVDRLQIALSRMLGSLADSVHEEVFHLSAVLNRQPTRLRLIGATSDLLPQSTISLAKVHGTLLKLVQQATVAINILRQRMRSDGGNSTVPAVPYHQAHYRTELVSNYNRLQTELTQARRVLTSAKQRVFSELSADSRALATQLTEDSALAGNTSDGGPADPWGVLVKHREELAYLDFMVGHVLTSYPGPKQHQATRGIGESQLFTWSRIWRPESDDLTTVQPDRLNNCRKPLSVSFIFGFLMAFKGIALVLCISLGLLFICASIHFAKMHCRTSRRQMLANLQHATKQWLAGTSFGPSIQKKKSRPYRGQPKVPVGEDKPITVDTVTNVSSGWRPPELVHGYSNPVCDIHKTRIVGQR